MTANVRNTVLLCLVFMAIVLAAFLTNFLREPLLDEEGLRQQGTSVLPKPREIVLQGLTDQRGEPFDTRALQGHWTFVFFGYTSCPDVCPVTLSALAQVERKLAESHDALHDSFAVVFVTVDPERDDQAKLAAYVSAFSPRFTGVRGSAEDLAEFARQVNAAFMKIPGEGGSYTMDHTANIVVINPKGHYHAFIRMPHEADKILLAYRSMAKSF